MKLSVLGPPGTFSHEAALAYDPHAEMMFLNTIYDVFDAGSRGEADAAIVPLENATSGIVGETLDALLEFDLKIKCIVSVKVTHNLLGLRKEAIKRLYVHPQAHGQCRNYIRKNFNGAEIIHTSSNSSSAKLAVKDDEGAIASSLAARLYGKKVLERGVEDNGTNITLFAVLSRESAPVSGSDRTFIVFGCVDRTGILHEILGVFAKRGINLSKIDSRPNKKKMGEYIFYIEFSGHEEDEHVGDVLRELGGKVVFMKVLGSYPAGV